MKALLNNERAPVTFGGDFIEISFSEYCDAFTSWWKRLKIDFETFSFEADLKEAMLRLEPLQDPQNRYLIVETQSNWTAVFSNSRMGSDVTSAVSHLCEVLGCRGVTVQCSPSLTKRQGSKTSSIVSYAATSFTLDGPQKTEWLNSIRHVSVRKDGGWIFFQRGEVQPFEQVEHYEKKHIRDRFTTEMLESYCAALGIRLFDGTFYGPKSFLVHQLTKCPRTSSKWTFQEAQAYLMINPLG